MKVHLRLGRRRMGLRHVSQLKGPARLGEDLRAALAAMVTHRRIRHAHRVVLIDQPPNRQPVDPMIAANRRKLLHPRPHPSASTFVTSGPGYPDADHAEAGPVQAVPTVAACRKVGPNQTVKTTPRHHAGGATSSRPPGANSGCHRQRGAAWSMGFGVATNAVAW